MENKEALGELAEFVYQAKVQGVDQRILRVMDTADKAFNEALKTLGLTDIHDDLARLVQAGVGRAERG